MKNLYIPKIVAALEKVDPKNTEIFKSRIHQFRPRLVLNMIDDPKEADRAQRIRKSCEQYLGISLEYLGLMFRDRLQDMALSSRLPVTVYKPHSVLSQAIFRIAEKVIVADPRDFDKDFNEAIDSSASFALAEEDAANDFQMKLSGIDDLIAGGELKTSDLIEMIKNQQYELTQVKKENLLLKSKIVKAAAQGFKL